MGRVVVPAYDEVVVDRLYPGNLQLRDTLPHLVEALERTLELGEAKRRRTVVRMDAGGGSMNGVNWLLKRGYHVHCKDISSKRAAHYGLSVRCAEAEEVRRAANGERRAGGERLC
jgi:hypothetical protein